MADRRVNTTEHYVARWAIAAPGQPFFAARVAAFAKARGVDALESMPSYRALLDALEDFEAEEDLAS